MQTIFAIEIARLGIFVIENAAKLQYVSNGRIARAIVHELRNMGYNVHAAIINSKDRGMPQNRARFWRVGIRRDLRAWYSGCTSP